MAARLLFVYGRAPVASGDWFEVPRRIFHAHVKAIPKLQAEEQLTRINHALVVEGCVLEDQARNKVFQELEDRANPDRKPIRPTKAMLESMGIKFKTVSKKSSQSKKRPSRRKGASSVGPPRAGGT